MVVLPHHQGEEMQQKFLKDSTKIRPKTLSNTLKNVANQKLQVTLVLFDIDAFRVTTKKLSTKTREEILSIVHRALMYLVQDDGLLLHIKNDRFAIVFQEVATDKIIDTTIHALSIFDSQFYVDGQKIFLTASAGIATSQYHMHTENLVKLAHRALKQAKLSGGNRFRTLFTTQQ